MAAIDKLDLFALKILGGSTDLAGLYGVAQNVAIVPRLFALSFSPLLLSTLTRLLRDGNEPLARNSLWKIVAPAASLVGSALLCGAAYTLAALWPASGLVLALKLAVIMLAIVAALLALGEFDQREIALARSLIPWPLQAL